MSADRRTQEQTTCPTLPEGSEIAEAFARMVEGLEAILCGTPPEAVVVVGIANGGLPLAKKVAAVLTSKLGHEIALGRVDPSYHRDDIGISPIPSEVARTELPFPVDGKTVILIDDVIESGRTVRAALNELFDTGRPSQVCLAVLCDRGGRCLPLQPDVSGMRLAQEIPGRVKLSFTPEAPAQSSFTVIHA